MVLKGKKQDENGDEDGGEAVSGNFQEPSDENGPIWVNKFSEDAARIFVKQLQHQSRLDPTGPITIYIDSFGGDVYALFTMIAAMEQIPNQIITCAMGKAMSAGAFLLACGDLRFATEHSTLMIHEISAGTGGHIDDMNIQHASFTKLNEKLMKLFVKKTNFKGGINALKKLLMSTRDLYIDPEEAVKMGIIDRIGIPMLHKNIIVQYVLSSNPRGNRNEQDAGVKKIKI